MTSTNDDKALVTREQEMATAMTLYGAEEDIVKFAYIVKKVAPWANPKNSAPFTDQEIGLTVRRSLAMGLDPLNPHEVQIWKDKRGNVNFQIAYTLMTEWVKNFKGNHTEPIFTRLDEADKDFELLEHSAEAFYAEFIMRADFDEIERLIKLGFSGDDARKMFTVRGIGVSQKDEYSSDYFAPNARSKAWKIQKRAVVDAYRKKFGTPTRPEIMELRRIGAGPALTIHDWKVAAENASPDATDEELVKIAESSAAQREKQAERGEETPEQTLVRNRALLHGDGKDPLDFDEDVVDGEIEDVCPCKLYGKPACNALCNNFPPPHQDGADTPIEQTEPEPRDAAEVRLAVRLAAKWIITQDGTWRKQASNQQEPPEDKEIKRLGALLGMSLKDDGDSNADVSRKRHSVLNYLVGKKSGKEATEAEVAALLAWIEATPGTWQAVNEISEQEARLCLRAEMIEAGQTELA
jgi:hypothetical protein